MSATRAAERALLGSLLIDHEALAAVRPIVGVEDFADAGGRAVYAAVLAVADRGLKVNYVDVECELEARGDFGRAVDWSVFVRLANSVPTSLYAVQYARRVAEAARKRRADLAPKDGGALTL